MNKKDPKIRQIDFLMTPVPNRLLEWMATNKLTPSEYRILAVILRKTLGFTTKSRDGRKKFDRIVDSQFAKATGMDRKNVWQPLNQLKQKGIIVCRGPLIGIAPEFYEDLPSNQSSNAIGIDGKMPSKFMATKDSEENYTRNINTVNNIDNSKQNVTMAKREKNQHVIASYKSQLLEKMSMKN